MIPVVGAAGAAAIFVVGGAAGTAVVRAGPTTVVRAGAASISLRAGRTIVGAVAVPPPWAVASAASVIIVSEGVLHRDLSVHDLAAERFGEVGAIVRSIMLGYKR